MCRGGEEGWQRWLQSSTVLNSCILGPRETSRWAGEVLVVLKSATVECRVCGGRR